MSTWLAQPEIAAVFETTERQIASALSFVAHVSIGLAFGCFVLGIVLAFVCLLWGTQLILTGGVVLFFLTGPTLAAAALFDVELPRPGSTLVWIERTVAIASALALAWQQLRLTSGPRGNK